MNNFNLSTIIYLETRKEINTMLNNKKITLGITGGIAAYKAADIANILTKEGADVKVIMTKHLYLIRPLLRVLVVMIIQLIYFIMLKMEMKLFFNFHIRET